MSLRTDSSTPRSPHQRRPAGGFRRPLMHSSQNEQDSRFYAIRHDPLGQPASRKPDMCLCLQLSESMKFRFCFVSDPSLTFRPMSIAREKAENPLRFRKTPPFCAFAGVARQNYSKLCTSRLRLWLPVKNLLGIIFEGTDKSLDHLHRAGFQLCAGGLAGKCSYPILKISSTRCLRRN